MFHPPSVSYHERIYIQDEINPIYYYTDLLGIRKRFNLEFQVMYPNLEFF